MFRIINENVKQNCINEIKALPLNSYQVKIERMKRSKQANALYWKWITIISDYTGYTKDELHEAFKRNFIGEDDGVDIFGNAYRVPKSSAKLNKKDFSEYMNKVHAFALGENITLPQPDYYGLELK